MSSDSLKYSTVQGFSIHHEIEMMSIAGMSPIWKSFELGHQSRLCIFDKKRIGSIKKEQLQLICLVEKNLEDYST